ncbi:hypothetical protein V6Z12_A09G140800 [Gossypium hirsutum]
MRWTEKGLTKQEEFQSKSRPSKTGQVWSSLKVFALLSLHDNEQRGAAIEAQIARARLYQNPTKPLNSLKPLIHDPFTSIQTHYKTQILNPIQKPIKPSQKKT